MSEVLYDGRFLRGVRRTRCAFRDVTVVTLGGEEYLISDMYPYEAHYRNSYTLPNSTEEPVSPRTVSPDRTPEIRTCA